jgi:hypothetical protein
MFLHLICEEHVNRGQSLWVRCNNSNDASARRLGVRIGDLVPQALHYWNTRRIFAVRFAGFAEVALFEGDGNLPKIASDLRDAGLVGRIVGIHGDAAAV